MFYVEFMGTYFGSEKLITHVGDPGIKGGLGSH